MDKRIDGKIAVFICGPVRYVTLVNERLETVLKDYDYDCFFHLWKSDLGNKVRQGAESDYRELFDHPRAKVVIMQSPYSEGDFKDKIGAKTNSGSTINATMGMFFSVNILCHYLKQLPDCEDYRYILRLRTDLAILSDDFASLLCTKPNVLTVAYSSITPAHRISDQICFGTVENFFKLWFFEDMNSIYAAYEEGARSPEQTLTCRYDKFAKDVILNRALVRFRDYHIVHFPPLCEDSAKGWAEPKTIIKVLNTVDIKEFFRNGGKYIDRAEIDEYNKTSREKRGRIEIDREQKQAFENGIDALNRGNASEAISCFDRSVSICQPFPGLNFARAIALVQLRKPISAIEACRAELELNPEHEGAKKLLAKLEKARLDFLQCVEKREKTPMHDYTDGMTHLQFEITHICNHNCELCDHRIRYSDYKYLTKDEYQYIVSCIGDTRDIKKILLIGGEPLCHPDFEWLAREIFNDFPNARIVVQTNAKLIPKLPKDLIARLFFRATRYDGFNDEIWGEYREANNFEWLENGPMLDPYRDPDLPEDLAKYMRGRCIYQIRIVGTNMYGCCVAEGIERYYKTEPVHVMFDKNWKENLLKLPTWKACQHCFKAIDRFPDICAAYEQGKTTSSKTNTHANSEKLEIAPV